MAVICAYNVSQVFFLTFPRLPMPSFFPYTTLFRSSLLYSSGDVANSSVTFPSVTTTALRFYQPANMSSHAYTAIVQSQFIDEGQPAPATDTTPPSAPMGPGATAASSSQINLVWTAS